MGGKIVTFCWETLGPSIQVDACTAFTLTSAALDGSGIP